MIAIGKSAYCVVNPEWHVQRGVVEGITRGHLVEVHGGQQLEGDFDVFWPRATPATTPHYSPSGQSYVTEYRPNRWFRPDPEGPDSVYKVMVKHRHGTDCPTYVVAREHLHLVPADMERFKWLRD